MPKIESGVRGDPRKVYKIPGTGKLAGEAPILRAFDEGGDLENLKFVSERGRNRDNKKGCC